MAARAHASYTAGRYEDALSQLTIASASGSSTDFRTLHNRALCEHGARGFSDPSELEGALQSIQLQLRGKSREGGGEGASDEEDEAGQAVRASTKQAAELAASSGGATAVVAAAAGLADLDADTSVLLYNLSALHFQQKQYGAAQAVLEQLFLHIGPLDDSLAIHICLLLLDVLCHSARGNLHSEASRRGFALQSAAVLAFLERPHALNSSSSSGGGDR